MFKRIHLSRLASAFGRCRTAIRNNPEKVKQVAVSLFDWSAGVASALFFLWLIGTAQVVYLDGLFAALACALASVVAAFRVREGAEDWPVSILSSAGTRRTPAQGLRTVRA